MTQIIHEYIMKRKEQGEGTTPVLLQRKFKLSYREAKKILEKYPDLPHPPILKRKR